MEKYSRLRKLLLNEEKEAYEQRVAELWNIGQRIAEVRREKGWKQERVAKEWKRSRVAISYYENGMGLSIKILNDFAKAYDCDIRVFFEQIPRESARRNDNMLQEIDVAKVIGKIVNFLGSEELKELALRGYFSRELMFKWLRKEQNEQSKIEYFSQVSLEYYCLLSHIQGISLAEFLLD